MSGDNSIARPPHFCTFSLPNLYNSLRSLFLLVESWSNEIIHRSWRSCYADGEE